MGSDIDLSIIIPCYNVPQHLLKACIQRLAFLQQTVTYEVWVIDDESQSDTACTWVESLGDPRLHVVRQAHTGPGGARNTGIGLAQGTYLTFVDADDYLIEKPYLHILNLLRQEKPDILCHGTRIPFTGKATSYMATHDIRPTCWSYIIRKSILEKLRFTPDICHEDEEFCTLLHLQESCLTCVPVTGYHYRFRPFSLIHHPQREAVEKRHRDFMQVLQRLRRIAVSGEGRVALQRRLHIMAMCHVITLMKEARLTRDLLHWIEEMKKEAFYPLPRCNYGKRYILLQRLLSTKTAVVLLAPFVKLYYHVQRH